MKKVVLLVAALFALTLGVAAAAPQKETKAAGKTHPLSGEVVSVDATAKTITLKTADGQTVTVPAEGRAATRLASLKAGEKVTAMCRDNEKGEHQAVVSIRPAGAKPAAKK